MSKHYRIMGTYKGNCEEIDNAENEKDARYLQGEYQLAYGTQWHVFVEVQTFNEVGDLDECYVLD